MNNVALAELELEDIRVFRGSGVIKLSPSINLLVGRNSCGKSTILRCIQLLQWGGINTTFIQTLPRVGCVGKVRYQINNIPDRVNLWELGNERRGEVRLEVRNDGGWDLSCWNIGKYRPIPDGSVFRNREPDNVLVHFLSKRKVSSFDNTHNNETSDVVRDDFRNLYSRINKIKGASKRVREEFDRLCEEIVGIDISSLPANNGVAAGVYVNESSYIEFDSMGEGIAHIVALIAELCLSSRSKIFLIEELENDLHPGALKALLNLILKYADKHQFIISTHSNIVLRYLGSHKGASVLSLQMKYGEDRLPYTVWRYAETEEDRQLVLKFLGYEPFDFGLWSGYLILEESSAQGIIERILIPHFVPELKGRLKIISANGASNVESSYTDFHRMYVYLHTNEIYNKSSWVVVDGDGAGQKAVAKLKESFPKVDAGHFINLKQSAFERYYPPVFKEEVEQVLAIADKQKKRAAKKELVEKVKKWAADNEALAKTEFEKSAAEVIDLLKGMVAKLK